MRRQEGPASRLDMVGLRRVTANMENRMWRLEYLVMEARSVSLETTDEMEQRKPENPARCEYVEC
jgi:hypothetical protein